MSESHSSSHRHKIAIPLALLAILLMGGAYRFYNVNWDKDTYHIHPDERHTAMVITAIQWPTSLGEYFDTSRSPLNPRNGNMVYFYGTLPLFLTKGIGTLLHRTGYDQIHLVGRVLSGLFDLGSVLLLFFTARRLFNWRVGLVASFLLSVTALNIQASHYFAVDTFLTFFVALTLWFTLDVADGKGWPAFVALGLAMGFTLACKVSVFLLVVVVALAGWLRVRRRLTDGEFPGRVLLRTTLGLSLAALVALAVFRVAQPYAWAGPNYDGWDTVPAPLNEQLRVLEKMPEPIRTLIMPNPRWIADIAEAGAQQSGLADMPWGRQWTERTPWLFPLENMVVWGMGAPLGIAAWIGVLWLVTQWPPVLSFIRHVLGGSVVGRVRRAERSVDPASEAGEGGQLWATRHWHLVLLPLAWVLLVFFWQGVQFVKSVRYFLPIYPFLVMFAAHLVVSVWEWARGRRSVIRAVAGAAAASVLFGALLWALAFIQIYREPITRVQASRWMYDNIETGASLVYRTADGETGQLQIPVPSTHIYSGEGQWLITPFTPSDDMVATEVVMNNLTGVDGPSQGAFEVAIADTDFENIPLAQARIEAIFGGEGGGHHVVDIPDVSLIAGQSYYFMSRVPAGSPLVSLGSAIAVEHFDDPLPFNLDGQIAYGLGSYRGLELTLYDEDTPEKLEKLLDTLDEADYISMSSGRLWQSIPRLPMRYPVTTRYYELLFAEELGFEKAAEFHSYPRLFGIEFDDTRAEEQFTVYDHPKVLIYRKTGDYSRAQVQSLLSSGIDWANIAHWLNPKEVPAWRREQARQGSIQDQPRNLKLTEEQRLVQEQGGTWASIFDQNSLPNRLPTLTWLVMIGALGLASLPLTVVVFRRLPDRGYPLVRPVGVLLLAWLSWILTNLTPLHYSRGTITLAFGLIALLSLASLALPGQRRRLLDLWHRQKRLLLSGEILFLAFFALFWLIRWGNPDLWHAWKGGEKPMDFAYLNAVIKSSEFPPYDPWFAGGYLNYYYFGQVMVGTLIKWIGIVPSVAYNLVIPLWFAMTAMGAFSVTYNLVAAKSRAEEERQAPDSIHLMVTERVCPEPSPSAEASQLRAPGSRRQPTSQWRPIAFGLVAAVFVAVLGNLGEIHLLLLKLSQGVLETFQSTIPGLADLVRLIVGSVEVLFGRRVLPIGIGEWYWNASRAIPAGPYESVITEFPFFTFLYADLHAHLIAMPLTFVSLAIALEHVASDLTGGKVRGRTLGAWGRELSRSLGPLLLWALAIGAMRTTNTWDVPPHLLVVLGALIIGEFARHRRTALSQDGRSARWSTWRLAGAVAWKFAFVFVLSWSVLYWPFWASYGSFYNSIGFWKGTRTPIWAYLLVHGLFLLATVSYLCVRVFQSRRGLPAQDDKLGSTLLRKMLLTFRYRSRIMRLRRVARIVHVKGLPVSGWVWTALGVVVLLEILFLVPGLISATRAQPETAAAGGYAYRGLSVFALGLPMAILGLALLLRPGVSSVERLWAFWVLLALAMTLGVEVIVIQGDIGRMNTVFKFYLQVWLLWGVTAAAALAWLVPRVRAWSRGRNLWFAVLAALLGCAALYPPLATSAKLRDRFDADLGPGLDGLAYMTTAHYWDPVGEEYDLKWDLEAIQWMQENVAGSPVILEGHTPEYRWGARYSINTGLPTVVGWNWHQRQQRAADNDQEVWERAAEVETMYSSPVFSLAETLLRKYNVRYIVVGPLERANYASTGLRKFEQAADEGSLEVAFRNQEVTIYRTAW